LQILALIALTASHGLASVSFFRTMRAGRLPSSIDFTTLSFFLYFDFGVAMEAAGLPYDSPYFPNFFQTSETTQLIALTVLIAAPWLLRLGALLIRLVTPDSDVQTEVSFKRPKAFLLFATAVSIAATAAAIFGALEATQIWQARYVIGSMFGPLIIVLFFPLYILAFYAVHRESQTRRGKMFAIFLVIASIAASLPIGERTLLLLPPLIFALFYNRVSLQRAVLVGLIGVFLAAVVLPIFKAKDSESDSTTLTLLRNVAEGDFYRVPILADSIEQSRLIGTKIFPYEGYGYVYSALFFVPRSWAPFKGYSSAQIFTGSKVGWAPEDLDWGFGISAIDEICLNFGILAIIPGLMLYGFAMESLDWMSQWFPVLIVPCRLAAIWLFGYHLPALLQDFGGMIGLGLVLQLVFSEVKHTKHAYR
jgi:hypothetical protein